MVARRAAGAEEPERRGHGAVRQPTYTGEQIIDAIRRWHAMHGAVPTRRTSQRALAAAVALASSSEAVGARACSSVAFSASREATSSLR